MPSHSDSTPNGVTSLITQDGVWQVDPSASKITFAVKTLAGLMTIRGTFAEYEGKLNAHSGNATGELTIKADSLDTGNSKRDQHLRSRDFFDTARHPRITFRVTSPKSLNQGPFLMGEVALKASQVPVKIPIELKPIGGGALSLHASTTISRNALGIAWNRLGMVQDEVFVDAQLTLKRASH
jgi:polyisoprenoid-binding protein YceI